jgi:DNA-binding response OmpR family regulator
MSLRVLVVDDEEDFLRSIVMRIELRGFAVHGVTSGDDAIAYLKENPESVDVVLLDIKMPGMDGIETLRQIKSCCPSIEVIVITGHASQEFNRLGRELGAFDYLIKPIRLEAIIERIEAADRRRQGLDAD